MRTSTFGQRSQRNSQPFLNIPQFSRPFEVPKAAAPAAPIDLQAKLAADARFDRALDQALTNSWVQRKVTIGQPNDRYEQEADRVAEQVMAMPEGQPVQRQTAEPEEEELQMKPLASTISPMVQREMMPEEEEKAQAKLDSNLLQREMLAEEEDEPIQGKSLVQREMLAEEEDEPLQMKPAADRSSTAGVNLESQLNRSKGGGSPLPDEVRSFMEPRFGADFGGVRVHTGEESVQMSRAIGAQAFTHGNDVYFGAGKAPGKDALTAHELTHVVQQSQSNKIQASAIQKQTDKANQFSFGSVIDYFTTPSSPPIGPNTRILDYSIDAEKIINEFNKLWKNLELSGSFDDHSLANEVKNTCESNYFKNNRSWNNAGGFVEDGSFNLSDVKVKISMTLKSGETISSESGDSKTETIIYQNSANSSEEFSSLETGAQVSGSVASERKKIEGGLKVNYTSGDSNSNSQSNASHEKETTTLPHQRVKSSINMEISLTRDDDFSDKKTKKLTVSKAGTIAYLSYL
ncbi:MAG: DUF4157 domain-containing protein [Synechococcales bacterium]|nr:DUF4157 domain-containing protein [Synechococcales bacterium]